MRASSCVNVSSLFNASSISAFPANFLRNRSGDISANLDGFLRDRLTRSTLFNLFCRDRKNSQNLYHDLHNNTHHLRRWRHLGVNLETLEEIFHALEDIDESVLTCTNILSRLKSRRYNCPCRRYTTRGYAPKGGRRLQQI